MSVALHVRSSYTLLQSTLTIPQIVECAKKHGYKAVALTDKQVLHGAMQFYHACKEAAIKPILGSRCCRRRKSFWLCIAGKK